MNKRYKIEGTHLLYRLAEILFKVNLQTIAHFEAEFCPTKH
jgi:hypothetical protein